MKKTILKNLKILSFGIIFALGVSYASAWSGVWNPRPASPTGGNIGAPIDVGDVDQVKTGDLSVDAFIANQDASFKKSIFFQNFIRGGNESSTGPTTVFFGDSTTAVNTTLSGAFESKKDIVISSLANNGVDDGLGNTVWPHVCSDKDGNVVFCEPPATVDLCTNDSDPLYTGTQTTVPAGSWRNSDGTCGHLTDICKNIPGPQATLRVIDGVSDIARADGTCYSPKAITASVSMNTSCTAGGVTGDFWASFGNGIFGSGKSVSGFYTLKISFPPLPTATKLALKVCTSHPGGETQWLNYNTWPDAVKICEGSPTIKDQNQFGWRYYRGSQTTTPGGFTDTFAGTKPVIIDIPAGATSVVTPELSCSREGTGNDLLWAYTYDLEAIFTSQQNANNSVESTFDLRKNTPICSNGEDMADC